MSNHQGCWLAGYRYIYNVYDVYNISPINRKFTGLHRFYRKVSAFPRTLGDASSNNVPVGHRHLQGQHDPKEAWSLRQPINGNKTGEQPLLKKFPAKKQLLLQQITYLYIFIAFYLEGFTWEFSIVSGELWDLNLVTYGNWFFLMMSRCSLSRNKWSHDDYSDIRQVQKDRWRSPTRDTDEGNHPRCTTWIPLRHAGYGAFLPVILKGSFRVWYLENNARDISVVLWSNFRVIRMYLGKLVKFLNLN